MNRLTIGATLTIGAALAIGAAACSSDSDTLAATTTTEPPPVACDTLVGLTTRQATDTGLCALPDGTVELQAYVTYDCPDGRTLSWNDHGWGYGDGTWQAHARADGQLVPPQPDLDACTGQ